MITEARADGFGDVSNLEREGGVFKRFDHAAFSEETQIAVLLTRRTARELARELRERSPFAELLLQITRFIFLFDENMTTVDHECSYSCSTLT